ncbi:hypothetical protein LLEC1_07890 [Akanthomyces lecanii]|uniref:Amino acid permease/ SLC12A domain-containing protein n=1 Tax=Cordyceps confragosa TaxID=2714763 RepID=A0A179I6I7_CORDF|nr:hypothetical protein LLEC1_07890 [Akanthomyces lecanii]
MRSDRNDSHGSAKSIAVRQRHADVETRQFSYSNERKLGIFSTAFLIINKMIGTGIFSAPATVFRATGSVGISLLLWLLGGILAFCGLSIYLELGLAIPRSGGEKNYLERIYRRPRYLASCILATQMVLLGVSAGHAVAFGQLIVDACSSSTPTTGETWAARAIGVGCVTLSVALHSLLPQWGVRLMNLAGVFKVVVLLVVAFSGVAALAGYRGTDDPHNFDHSFSRADMQRYGAGGGFSAYSSALLSIVYTFSGWESANYLDLATSELLVAALFFRNMFGESAAAKTLPVFVAVSSLGSVLATSFAHSRLNQELGKERLLPFGRFWASSMPCNAPAASVRTAFAHYDLMLTEQLVLHWIITVIMIVAPPLGHSYDAIIELSVYPRAWINMLLTVGLVHLQWNKSERWKSPWHTYLPISILYFLFNGLFIIGPFVPSTSSSLGEGHFYLFPLVGIAVLLSGVLYWAIWIKLVPRVKGYRIEVERVFSPDEIVRYRRVSL